MNNASPFRSFLQGGFEGCTHRRPDRRQLDLIAATNHDIAAALHYGLLAQAGIATARDALRWHLIEQVPHHYDWSSFLPMLKAARRTGTQVVWDLCHWGLPHHIDIWSEAFVEGFASFAAAAAGLVRDHSPEPPIYCAINEISFWSWAGGDKGWLYPHQTGQATALKRQLARAAIAAIKLVKQIDPRARFVHPEPLVNVVCDPAQPWLRDEAEGHNLAQFDAWDMIAGRRDPELGGSEDLLDILGVNFYYNNQWIYQEHTLAFGHHFFRPLGEMLQEIARRYGRPIMVSETGAEGGNGAGWFSCVMTEVRHALLAGVPVAGVCLYPIMDYPGWDDGRHCRCGLIATDASFHNPVLESRLLRDINDQDYLFRLHGLGSIFARRPQQELGVYFKAV